MKNKLFSIFTALAMVLGILVSPFTSAMAAEDGQDTTGTVTKDQVVGTITADDIQADGKKPDSTKLNIHKLVADKLNITEGLDHNGGKLSEEQYKLLGQNVKGLDGVEFTIYKITDEETFNNLTEAEHSTKDQMNTLVTGNKAEVAQTVTTAGGGLASANLAEGNYWVIESKRPTSVTSSLAVPFKITLPLLNQVKVGDHAAGTVYMKNVHVYPKNTSEKPEMDKYFDEPVEGTDSTKLTKNHQMHPDYKKYTEKKAEIDARIGSKVPYEVKTSLKKGQRYETLSWSDVMTSGLKYNKDVTLTYKGSEGTDVTVDLTNAKSESDFGFDITINDETTINNINEALKSGNVEFTLKYTATLTRDAVVDLPESNNITFTPGEPSHKNNNTPENPTDGKVTVTKTWAEGDAPSNVLVTYVLYEATTPIASVTLKGTEIQSKSLPEGVTVTNDGYNVTFSGLDNDKTYKVEEFADGYDPSYTGAFGVKNTSNPDRITPTPPYVVTYGKKFVKTDDNKNRLAGAEFVVKDGKGTDAKYLVAKTDDKIAAQQEAVKNAKDALDKAVEAYNKLEADKQTDEERAKVTTAQDAYNKAVKAAGNVYEWGDKANAITLVSNGQGQFEITGLPEGTYYLEETKAPAGFAKLTEDVEFKVGKGTYNGENTEFKYEVTIDESKGEKQTYGKQIVNKKVTIPQTGGIGSLIFVVAGLAIMAGAYVAYRKNQARA